MIQMEGSIKMKKEMKILLILIGILFFIIIVNVHVPYFNYKNETNEKKFDVMTESSFIFKPCKLNKNFNLFFEVQFNKISNNKPFLQVVLLTYKHYVDNIKILHKLSNEEIDLISYQNFIKNALSSIED